jgi:hypothetical protein
MTAVSLKILIAVELHRDAKGMRILWADLATNLKIRHARDASQFSGCRKKI